MSRKAQNVLDLEKEIELLRERNAKLDQLINNVNPSPTLSSLQNNNKNRNKNRNKNGNKNRKQESISSTSSTDKRHNKTGGSNCGSSDSNTNTKSNSSYLSNFLSDLKRLHINKYSSIRMIELDEKKFSKFSYYFVYIGFAFGFLCLVPLAYLEYSNTPFERAALSSPFHTALLSSIFICVPCILNLLADNQALRYFLDGNKLFSEDADLQEWNYKIVEQRKRIWFSQVIFIITVFPVDIYLFYLNSKQYDDLAAIWLIVAMSRICIWYGVGLFILSSFEPEVFTLTRCMILVSVNSLSRICRAFSYNYPQELALTVLDNAFISIAYGGLMILAIITYRNIVNKLLSTRKYSSVKSEDLVAAIYVFLGIASQISISIINACFRTPQISMTEATELCCYQYTIILIIIVITILPLKLANLQTSHSTLLIKEFKQKKKQNIDLLHHMLPPKVAYHILMGRNFVPTQYDKITVYLCDLERFTKKTLDSDPIDVVNFMNDLYVVMDYVVSKTKLHKLDMSSNIYICASGIVDSNLSIVENACEIIDFSLLAYETVRSLIVTTHKLPVELKAGVHTGKCLGAVTGNHLPKFVLMGNAVNVSNTLEYQATDGEISVSAITAKIVMKTGYYIIEEKTSITANINIPVKTYYITGVTEKHPTLTLEYFSTIKAEAKKLLDQSINRRSKISINKSVKKVDNNIIQYYLDSKNQTRILG